MRQDSLNAACRLLLNRFGHGVVSLCRAMRVRVAADPIGNRVNRRPASPCRNRLRELSALALSLMIVAASAHAAEPLPPPTDKVLLTIRGNVSLPNVGDEVQFDREALEALPLHGFDTETPWDEGVQSFEGVLLRDVLRAAGAGSANFEAIGSDDYRARFADIDIEGNAVLLATRQNGKNLTLRTLGPLRIIFPFDDNADFYSQSSMAAAVWQIVAMDIE